MADEKHFSLWKTGLRPGEYVKGVQNVGKKNIGTVMQINMPTDKYLAPYAPYFDPEDLKIRDQLNFGFFETMTFDERNSWLRARLSQTKQYLNAIDKCELRFISIGGEFLNLSIESQQRLMGGEWIDIQEVCEMFPKKPGSNARNHTLMFRGSIWKLIDFENEQQKQADIYFDLLSGQQIGIPEENSRICYVSVNNKIIGLVDAPIDDLPPSKNEIIANAIDWFTPGILKSCIQKCIRMQASQTNIGNAIIVDTKEVLITTFLLLLENPGSFVPDLKMFVKGKESAMKRLAVSILEDSYAPKNVVESLLLAALAARNDWKFSNHYVNLCCEWAIMALENRDYFDYKMRDPLLNATEISYDTLKELGSFDTDLKMLNSICKRNFVAGEQPVSPRPNTMEIYHIFDNHCTTSVVNLFPTPDPPMDPIGVISLFWNHSSRYNPRKHTFVINPEVKQAQKLFWKIKTANPTEVAPGTETLQFARNIDESWISGMIGAMEHKIKTESGKQAQVMSFFHPRTPSQIMTIRSPSRAKDEDELTDADQILSISKIETRMEKMFKLTEPAIQVDHWFQFVDGAFLMSKTKTGEKMQWTDFCTEMFNVPELTYPADPAISLSGALEVILRDKQNGIASNWRPALGHYLDNLPIKVIYRLGMYLRPVNIALSVNKISRDGSGTYLSVNWTDSQVFKFFCFCAYVAPVAIGFDDHQKLTIEFPFKIKNIFIWNHIRDIVFDKIGRAPLFDWGRPRNADIRPPKEHQTEAIESIVDRMQQGKRGSIMYLTVGAGKTYIVIRSLFALMELQMLPRYVVYTLPPSANESVLAEFSFSGLPVHRIDVSTMGVSKNNHLLREFHINFINHDHLRSRHMAPQFEEHATDIFLILDEFHLMMSLETKRTSVSLELSKICQNFIAMTGTLVKNKDPNGIIEWVSQVVDFELKPTNFTVGVCALISRKINFGIEEKRHFIDIPMTNPGYALTVGPEFGGAAERIDFRRAVDICYEVLRVAIIEKTIEVLERETCVFVVAQGTAMQTWLANEFEGRGLTTFCVNSHNSIRLTPDMPEREKPNVIISTIRHSTGYTLTACKTMISAVYFSNQATRTQIEGRIIRMGQPSPFVDLFILHTGILSYTLKHYENARSLEKCLNDLAKDI